MNTHFDHVGKRARVESAKLLRERVQALSAGSPAILTGDFNARESDEPHRKLCDEMPGRISLIDVFRVCHPEHAKEEGTFHGFTGDRTRDRIDWVFCTNAFESVSCEIVRQSDQDGRFPSDHFPVLAELKWSGAKQ